MSREYIFEGVEIDIPRCGLVFGTSPCTATLSAITPRKCWNMLADCGDKANYDPSATLTLRVCKDGPMPKGQGWLPVLSRVSASSATVNIAGSDPDMSGLGRQATFDFQIGDHRWHDQGVDPYLADRKSGAAQFSAIGQDPATRGMFWTKMKSRWPYYADAPVRYIRAYLVDGVLTDVKTTHFFLKEWAGPNNGVHKLSCLGVLDFANKKTALAPKPSKGALVLDLAADATTFDVTPAGASYAASGKVCIGREIMTFTKTGDTFTVVRGQAGTQAATHARGDTVQEVLSFDRVSLDEFVNTLVEDYTDTPADYLTPAVKATNAAEIARWGASIRIKTDLVAPVPVANLLAEATDLGCSIWADDDARELRIKMNRPVDGETVLAVSDRDMKDMTQEDDDGKRLTQVLFCSKRLDVTKFSTDPADYAIKVLTIDPDALTNYGGKVRTRTICTRLLDQGDESTVSIASTRLLKRFNKPPKEISITLDARSNGLGLVDVISASSDDFSGSDGDAGNLQLQVKGKREPTPYHDVEFICQLFQFAGRFGFIMPDGSPVYGSATDEQKRTGAFILGDGDTAFPDGMEPYRII